MTARDGDVRPAARSARWWVALAVCAAGAGAAQGCGDDREDRARPPPTAAAPGPEAAGVRETREADPRLPPAQLGLLEGNVTLGQTAAVSGAAVEVGRVVSLEGPGRATLDLPGGARGTLWAPGAMLLAEAPDRGLWIVRGAVHVSDPPTGLGGRTPLRVATPTATLELQGAGDAVVSVDAQGITHVTVLNGQVEVTSAEVDTRRRLRSLDVVAGLETQVIDHIDVVVPGSARLEEALALARERAASASASAPGAPAPPSVAATMSRLDDAMGWLEAEQRRGRDLTARHRAAVQAGQGEEAMQYQREIVSHAQAVHALRQVVLTRWERFALTARLLAGARPASEEVAPRLDRLRNLLGS